MRFGLLKCIRRHHDAGSATMETGVICSEVRVELVMRINITLAFTVRKQRTDGQGILA